MKFGGTSVEDAQAMKRTAGDRSRTPGTGARARRCSFSDGEGYGPAFVCRVCRWPGRQGGRTCHRGQVAASASRHLASFAGRGAICPSGTGTASRVRFFRRPVARYRCSGRVDSRTNDLVVSFGERLSSRMIAEAFEQYDLNGIHVDARTCIITDATTERRYRRRAQSRPGWPRSFFRSLRLERPRFSVDSLALHGGYYYYARSRWKRLHCCVGWRWHACGRDRDMD